MFSTISWKSNLASAMEQVTKEDLMLLKIEDVEAAAKGQNE